MASEELQELLLVELEQPVRKGTAIAGEDSERGRRVFAPIDGYVMWVGDGRIVMQEPTSKIELEAGVRGQVVQVIENRGVAIEATGGVIQGVWGNDRHVIASIRFEPEHGIVSIAPDDIENTYRGDIVITQSPLIEREIDIAIAQSFAGLIAPSMDSSLLEKALNTKIAIMLTTGFGQGQIARNVLNVLELYEGYQGVMDAALPQRFSNRRPELMIHRMVQDDLPVGESIPLQEGMKVRITRAPYAGRTGEVVDLPSNKVRMPNGLRVKVARVEVAVDEIVDVPLVNLELAGI